MTSGSKQGQVAEHATFIAAYRCCCKRCGLVVQISLAEYAVLDTGIPTGDRGVENRSLVGCSEEHKVRVDDPVRDQFPAGRDSGMHGLNGLVRKRDVAANDDVDVAVGLRVENLGHGHSPVGCQSGGIIAVQP